MREWLRLKREKKPISLISGVIDNFSIQKSEWSESQIRILLKTVRQGIADGLNRPTDVFTDYQPERFCILLSNTSTEGAKKVLKKSFKQTFILNRESLLILRESSIQPITISFSTCSLVPSSEMNLNNILGSLVDQF